MLSVDFQSPLFWAILIGWILSVTLHEFAHGLVAFWGGDYTIRERGGLTLNPLYYVDPFMSIILPAIFLAMGGIPLPGGATFIRSDLLRNRKWESGVALAGPLANFLLFVAFAAPLHPAFGWYEFGARATPGQTFCGAMATLQFLAMCLNLVPVPPLDGFRAIAPLLGRETEEKMTMPPTGTILFLVYFFVLWKVPAVIQGMLSLMGGTLDAAGFGANGDAMPYLLYSALYGKS
jgi:Zn-dependent protease